MKSLDDGIRDLLDQCDREDQNSRHGSLYTSEIRELLGVGPGPDYSALEAVLRGGR